MELKLIDHPSSEVQLDEIGSSCEQHILAVSGLLRLLERGLDPWNKVRWGSL